MGPLHGLKVIELAGIGPAPFAAMWLADQGADVLRVDRPGGGTTFVDPAHDPLLRGKRSVVLDLKHPDAVATVLRLAERADVLLEAFRPGVAERLGVGPEQCAQANPRLVYGRMTGWGQDGPLATTAGHDVTYLAVSGALNAIGDAAGPPQIPINLVGDFGGGAMYLVSGVLAAVFEAQRSGRGQVVDAAIVDGVAHLSSMVLGMRAGEWSDERGTNLLDGGSPFYSVYETSDHRYVAIGPLEPQFYAELLRLLELEDVPDRKDKAQWPRLRHVLAERFAQRTQAEWTELFADSDACVAPVMTFGEAAAHPHLVARGTFVEQGGQVLAAPAPRFSRTPADPPAAPAEPGRDTVDALQEWGIPDVDGLLATGAAVQAGRSPD